MVRPEKLSGYFVQAASGPLVEGATVKWRFAEVPGEHEVQRDNAIFLHGVSFLVT